MAYAVHLDTECTEAGCHRRATYEVRDAWNATIRKCCQRHAEQLVAKLSADGR
jgi:hypothetical protein